ARASPGCSCTPRRDANHAWPDGLRRNFPASTRPQFNAALALKRGRFVHIPHQLLETNRETAALVLCEKPAHLAGVTARLQDESAGVKRRWRGVECNPRPMSRKYR